MMEGMSYLIDKADTALWCRNVDLNSWHTIPFFINAREPTQNDNLIPKKIFQTNERQVLSGMKDAIYTWINNNPQYEYHYFTSEMCRQFIADNFPTRVLNAYDMLIPGAFKADLWRYCVLYINGGVYIDSAMVDIVPLREIIKPDDSFIVPIDTDIDSFRPFGLYNAFMCSTPKHPLLARVIDIVVENVESRYYGERDLAITGPIALADAYNDLMGKPRGTLFDFTQKENSIVLLRRMTPRGEMIGNVYDDNGDILIKCKYKCFVQEKQKWSKLPSYSVLWKKRQVYAD
jgi:hypothetical protein